MMGGVSSGSLSCGGMEESSPRAVAKESPRANGA